MGHLLNAPFLLPCIIIRIISKIKSEKFCNRYGELQV